MAVEHCTDDGDTRQIGIISKKHLFGLKGHQNGYIPKKTQHWFLAYHVILSILSILWESKQWLLNVVQIQICLGINLISYDNNCNCNCSILSRPILNAKLVAAITDVRLFQSLNFVHQLLTYLIDFYLQIVYNYYNMTLFWGVIYFKISSKSVESINDL